LQMSLTVATLQICLTKIDTFEASVVSFTVLASVCFFIGIFILTVSYNRKSIAKNDCIAKIQI
jgi:hypothetical protein